MGGECKVVLGNERENSLLGSVRDTRRLAPDVWSTWKVREGQNLRLLKKRSEIIKIITNLEIVLALFQNACILVFMVSDTANHRHQPVAW